MIRPTLNRWVYNLAIGVIRLQRYTFTWSHHNCTVTILQLSNSGVSLGSKLKFKGIDGRAPPARLAGFHYRGTKHHQVCSMDPGSWQNAIYSVIHDVVSWKQGVFRCDVWSTFATVDVRWIKNLLTANANRFENTYIGATPYAEPNGMIRFGVKVTVN